jgi:hypothetical protein
MTPVRTMIDSSKLPQQPLSPAKVTFVLAGLPQIAHVSTIKFSTKIIEHSWNYKQAMHLEDKMEDKMKDKMGQNYF